MVLAFGFMLVSVILASVEATCTNANANCATWVPNGFCSSSFYTCAQKQSYCALSCNIGGCSPQTTCSTTGTCVNNNANTCSSSVTTTTTTAAPGAAPPPCSASPFPACSSCTGITPCVAPKTCMCEVSGTACCQ
uniref:ShKT domain-containing protein n=1 Tax=Acrobeloides nanus TaxID=290746 RepID=A0A914E4T7_9BILA